MKKGTQPPFLFFTLFLVLVCLVPQVRAAADWDPVTDAEKSMKTNPLDPGSGAVVLFKRGEIQIKEKSSLFWVTTIRTYARIKILTDAGRESANVSVDSPKWVRFGSLEGRTILPSGEIIPLDPSQVFRGRAFENGKHYAVLQTSFTLPSVVPGAIIEYSIEQSVDWFYPPPWVFDTRGLGTLHASLKVLVGPRLALAQYPIETTQSKIAISRTNNVEGDQLNYTIDNLRPDRSEPFSVPFRDQASMVIFSPYKLAFGDGVYPIITSWNDVGEKVSAWLDDVNKMNKEARSKAKEIAEKAPDDRQRAQAIYQYIQENIVSSSLGGVALGRTADEVITSKRGDPDEINSLFVTMLKEVKVDADVVLISARNDQTLAAQFPNLSQFSRMITRINLKQGMVLADPSEAAAAFGDLSWPEKGIVGLAVKGKKIQQVNIPIGAPDDNTLVSKLDLKLSDDWKVEGDEEVDFKGSEAIDFRGDLLEVAPEKLDERLTDFLSFGMPDASVAQIAHPDLRDSSKPFVLKAHLKSRLVDESGPGELLLNPWIADRYRTPVFKSAERHSAIRFEYPEKRVSTSSLNLPLTIHAVTLPKDVSIDNDLGSFSHSCVQNGTLVTCTRSFALKKTDITDRKDYLNAKSFFEEVAKHDQEVIILRGQ